MLRLGATLTERILSSRRRCSRPATATRSRRAPSCCWPRICGSGPRGLPPRSQRGQDRPDDAVVRDRARAPAPAAGGVLASGRDRAHVRPRGGLDGGLPRSTSWTPSELRAASLAEAEELAGLNAAAHTATKLRAREGALAAIRAAIESELTVEGLGGASAPRSDPRVGVRGPRAPASAPGTLAAIGAGRFRTARRLRGLLGPEGDGLALVAGAELEGEPGAGGTLVGVRCQVAPRIRRASAGGSRAAPRPARWMSAPKKSFSSARSRSM